MLPCRFHSVLFRRCLSSAKVSSPDNHLPNGVTPFEFLPTPPKVEGVERTHQWREWTELVELLFKKGYLDINAVDGPKNSNLIRTACLNFARDRFDLIRYFSRQDIHVMAGVGCPSLDRKVVNSGKRLRAYVGINEGDVCSSCNLRGRCERAYVNAFEDEGGRTVDVMRFLLTYGLDLTNGSLDKQPSFTKHVKESVKKLMNEMVEFGNKEFSSNMEGTLGGLQCRMDKKSSSHPLPKTQINVPMKQGDWICPKCNFLNFAKNIKCLRCAGVFQERLDKLREEREHLPLKKGDWICEKCHFLNFAKNSRCLQCQEKPPKRHLNPGEWECVSCNYINFRKNMACLKCDWKRPKASNNGGIAAEPNHNSMRLHQKHSSILFVANSPEASFWSCDEETEDDDNDCNANRNSWNRFADNFPIVGGSSVISKDPLLRERWREKMSRSGGIPSEGSKETVGDMNFSVSIDSELDECSDEDDLAGWFREKSGN